MKYFMDCEFFEYQPYQRIVGNEWKKSHGANAIQLISIGIVAEDGREFYAENADFDWDFVPEDHWLQDNVRPHLWGEPQPLERASDIIQPWRNFRRYMSREGGHWHVADIADAIKHFVDPGKDRNRDQFYGWYCDYDWVVFCGLFGRMIDLPDGFPMYMRDLKQAADMIGNPDLSAVKVEGPEHHALTDARDVRAKYLVLDHVYAGFARP